MAEPLPSEIEFGAPPRELEKSATNAPETLEEPPRAQLPTVRRLRPGESKIHAVATIALLLLSYLFRLPPLLNARSTNSDAAVVGLQAMHLLRGELSPFLWGSGYQTSADSFVAAAFFVVLGPTPFALMVSALTLHVVATWLVFATLRRRLEPWTALLVSLPLVFAPSSIHTYALYPPRQLSITLAVAALWAIDGAALRGPRALRWLVAGGMLYGLAISADPYPMVLAPIVLGYGLAIALERPLHSSVLRAHEAKAPSVAHSSVLRAHGAKAPSVAHSSVLRAHGAKAPSVAQVPRLAGATLVGLVPFLLLHLSSARARSGPMGLTTNVLGHNWDLLVHECLPWALSYKVYYAYNVMDYRPWTAPAFVQVIQIAGGIAVGIIVAIGLGSVFVRSLPLVDRRLGFAGAMTYPVAIGAFLVSVMVMDHFSMRYLAVLTLMLPFAAMPAARLLGRRRFALLVAPHLIASAIGGWVGYGPFVRGLLPVTETPELHDDYVLLDLLRARGIAYAEADYWASYRLSFLFRESIVVVPSNPAEDRYAPQRRAFEAAPVFAYVFDPGRSRENLTEAEAMLRRTNAGVERSHAGGHTVFFVTRKSP